MRFNNWTVGELVAYLSGNRLFGEVDCFLDGSLRGDKGLISGELHIRANPKKLKTAESEEKNNDNMLLRKV